MFIETSNRSLHSVRFEKALRDVSLPGVLPRVADIGEAALGDLQAWIAIVEPNNATRRLIILRAGAAINALLGRDAAGLDYLDMVDPAIHGEAFDSAFLMLTRPCGLWQMTPSQTRDGKIVSYEYTGFPVFDHVKGRGQIMILIQPAVTQGTRPLDIAMVRHATDWCWLEMR